MEFLICGFLNLQEPLIESEFSGEFIALVISYFCMTTALLLPIILGIALFKLKARSFQSSVARKRFEPLIEGLRTSSKVEVCYIQVFIMRRLVFCYVAFFMSKYPSLQVMAILLS